MRTPAPSAFGRIRRLSPMHVRARDLWGDLPIDRAKESRPSKIEEIDILWMTAGLGLRWRHHRNHGRDPASIEDIVTGALPWTPKVKF